MRQDRIGQLDVLARIDVVMAAGQHRDGAGRKARAMGARVDAAREPGDDGQARGAEIAREPLGEAQARGRGVARADDRHRG